ncbi:MAG: hypothetical protein KC613_19155 [Myxococcales bacterium]|nr:hypothetical protein [Myxococcales bacterium]MCB9526287.1 hypothetical protein [Myxococcales bacterium]
MKRRLWPLLFGLFALTPGCDDEPGPCDKECAAHGWCQETADGTCIATSREDCEGSDDCAEEGYCSYAGGGLCKIGSSSDCRSADVCSEYGRCEYRHGDCCAVAMCGLIIREECEQCWGDASDGVEGSFEHCQAVPGRSSSPPWLLLVGVAAVVGLGRRRRRRWVTRA